MNPTVSAEHWHPNPQSTAAALQLDASSGRNVTGLLNPQSEIRNPHSTAAALHSTPPAGRNVTGSLNPQSEIRTPQSAFTLPAR